MLSFNHNGSHNMVAYSIVLHCDKRIVVFLLAYFHFIHRIQYYFKREPNKMKSMEWVCVHSLALLACLLVYLYIYVLVRVCGHVFTFLLNSPIACLDLDRNCPCICSCDSWIILLILLENYAYTISKMLLSHGRCLTRAYIYIYVHLHAHRCWQSEVVWCIAQNEIIWNGASE